MQTVREAQILFIIAKKINFIREESTISDRRHWHILFPPTSFVVLPQHPIEVSKTER